MDENLDMVVKTIEGGTLREEDVVGVRRVPLNCGGSDMTRRMQRRNGQTYDA